MEKNKRNKKLSLLLILAIISLVVLISSFAKYTSDLGTVPGTAKVATWNVSIDQTEDSNIFKHSFEKYITNNDGNGNYIIAPGVSGAYEITISNNSDVAARISTFEIKEVTGNAAVPMEFSTTGTDGWGTLSAAKATLETEAKKEEVEIGSSKTIGTLYWRWPYTANAPQDDAKDTALGTASYTALSDELNEDADRTSYGLTLNIVAEQVEPATK